MIWLEARIDLLEHSCANALEDKMKTTAGAGLDRSAWHVRLSEEPGSVLPDDEEAANQNWPVVAIVPILAVLRWRTIHS